MPARTRISLLAGVFAIAIGGCGSGDDGTIPPQTSEELLNMLTQVESLVETGNCAVAVGPVTELTDAINELPDDVDSEVQSALTKGASNLLTQIKDPDNCPEGATGGAGAEPTTTTETSTTQTSTTTVPEETSTVEEPTEEPQTEEPTQTNEPPPTGNNGQGNEGPQGPQGPQGGGGGPASGGVDVPGGKR
jgi:hypothetical protein